MALNPVEALIEMNLDPRAQTSVPQNVQLVPFNLVAVIFIFNPEALDLRQP